MAEDTSTIECQTHGLQQAAFVCQHLFAGEKQDFYCGYSADDPDALYPDAWCEACEETLNAKGEWTEIALKFADIRVVCHQCYVDIRAKNWRQDDREFDHLGELYLKDLQEKQNQLWEDFKIDAWERWDWSMAREELVFSHEGQPRVKAKVAFVGTESNTTNTWMWAWGNTSLPENTREATQAVRLYGEEQHFMKLATGFWRLADHDGWLMTAFATHLLNGIGAYRTPGEHGYTYMVILEASLASIQP